MKLDIITFIVIVAIVCLGALWAWCDDISCKVWAEQWDDLDKKLEYSKLGLIYPPNENKDTIKFVQNDAIFEENLKQFNRAVDNMMCSTQQIKVPLEQLSSFSDYIKDYNITFKTTMSTNEARKMLGLDEIEEHEPTIKDFTVKGAPQYDNRAIITDEGHEEPKPKKLEPLICKMCGGTVAKKGDIYECEYCGLHYELR